jgi:hypothetical protein
LSVTPLGALVRGAAAGVAASYTMDRFLEGAAKILPDLGTPKFEPPEEAQRHESPTETVARRFYEGMMQRGPLSPERKARLATAVHYWFGLEWASLYALARESIPAVRGPGAGLALGTLVWGLGDYGLVPAFRLGAGFKNTPPGMIAFTWAAHAVYGLTAWAVYEASRPRTWAAAAATLFALRLDRRARAKLPEAVLTKGTRRMVRRAASRAAFLGAMGATVPKAVAQALH